MLEIGGGRRVGRQLQRRRARGDVDPAPLVVGRAAGATPRRDRRARSPLPEPGAHDRRAFGHAGAGLPATSRDRRAGAAPSPCSPGRQAGTGGGSAATGAPRSPGPCRRGANPCGSEAGGARSDRPRRRHRTAPAPPPAARRAPFVRRGAERPARPRATGRPQTSRRAARNASAETGARSASPRRRRRRRRHRTRTAQPSSRSPRLARRRRELTRRAAAARPSARRPRRAGTVSPRHRSRSSAGCPAPVSACMRSMFSERQLQLLRAFEQAARRFRLPAHHRQRPLVDDGLGLSGSRRVSAAVHASSILASPS